MPQTRVSWRLRAARLLSRGYRPSEWTVPAIRSRADRDDATTAVDDRAVLLLLLESAQQQAALPVDEMVDRLRADSAALRDDDRARVAELEAEVLALRTQVNELATRLTTAAEVVAPLPSLLVVPREVRHVG